LSQPFEAWREREEVKRKSKRVGEKAKSREKGSKFLLGGGMGKSISFLAGSQAPPACPADEGTMKVKMLT
jgi:hypothetical protein